MQQAAQDEAARHQHQGVLNSQEEDLAACEEKLAAMLRGKDEEVERDGLKDHALKLAKEKETLNGALVEVEGAVLSKARQLSKTNDSIRDLKLKLEGLEETLSGARAREETLTKDLEKESSSICLSAAERLDNDEHLDAARLPGPRRRCRCRALPVPTPPRPCRAPTPPCPDAATSCAPALPRRRRCAPLPRPDAVALLPCPDDAAVHPCLDLDANAAAPPPCPDAAPRPCPAVNAAAPLSAGQAGTPSSLPPLSSVLPSCM
nr:translation initiation factor IF-2-like [Aegilops tauschii subsp. strangulata]